jgi:hypothetical protein
VLSRAADGRPCSPQAARLVPAARSETQSRRLLHRGRLDHGRGHSEQLVTASVTGLAVPSRAQPSAATRANDCREPSWASDRSRSRKRHRNRAAPSSLRHRRRWIAMLVFTFLWFSKAKLMFPAAVCQICRALKLENGDLLAPCNVQHAAFCF